MSGGLIFFTLIELLLLFIVFIGSGIDTAALVFIGTSIGTVIGRELQKLSEGEK